jgi:retron-type reverse transcriptase
MKEKGNRKLSLDTFIPEGLNIEEQIYKYLYNNASNYYKGVHKLISNPKFLLIAYSNLRKNKGLDTVGVDGKALDGLSKLKLEKLGKEIHTGLYKVKPVKRVFIKKKNGDKRPLVIPSTKDRLVQEAMRIILDYIFDDTFCETSHGFRSGYSCHTALNYYKYRFQRVS